MIQKKTIKYVEDLQKECNRLYNERKAIIDFIENCPGNYYGDKVFTPGEYHYYVVDKKKLKAVLNANSEQEEICKTHKKCGVTCDFCKNKSEESKKMKGCRKNIVHFDFGNNYICGNPAPYDTEKYNKGDLILCKECVKAKGDFQND